MIPQAGQFCYEATKGPAAEQHATLAFHDQNQGSICEVESEYDPTRGSTVSEEVGYQEFFKRPVEIFTRDWNVDSNLNEQINPLDRWMKDPRIANRLSNFRNFSGKLNLKFMINGNGFY